MNLVPRDPLPGHPLVYRIDTRACRNADFWCRVRQAYLPKLKGRAFWVSSLGEVPGWFPNGEACVELDRRLMIQFLPEYVRLSPAEREVIKRYYITREKGFVRNSKVMDSLRSASLIRGGKLTTLGTNSYHLSP